MLALVGGKPAIAQTAPVFRCVPVNRDPGGAAHRPSGVIVIRFSQSHRA
nr:C50 [uncultured bacterium]